MRIKFYVFIFFIFLAKSISAQELPIIEKLKKHQITIIEINTINNEPIISKEYYLKGSINVYEPQNAYKVWKDSTEIKGRGNSTWEMPKKPYRIKLATSKSISGMPASKHWALLANYEDKSASRTKLASDLGNFLGITYTPRSIPVELIINGEHTGSYQLIEVPKIDPKRIDITQINTKNNITTGGVIFELNLRLDETYNFYTNNGVPISIKDPDDLNAKTPEIADKHFNYLINILNTAEDALYSENFTSANNGYSKYFNVSSVIDFYLVEEILKNFDVGEYSIFKYVDTKNGNKITYGPIWDFDLSTGNREDPYGFKAKVENRWFNRFFEDPVFEKQIKDKWLKIRSEVLYAMTSSINNNFRLLRRSLEENQKIWEYTRRWDDRGYQEDVEFIKKWLYERVQWIDKQWTNNPIVFNPVVYDKFYTIDEDSPLSENLYSEECTDTSAKFVIIKKPIKGSINLTNPKSGTYIYTPFENINGVDSFYFTKSVDGTKYVDTGLVVIDIAPVNDAPTLIHFSDTLQEDQILIRSEKNGWQQFSIDAERDKLVFELIQAPKHGKLNLNEEGAYSYTPDQNFNGIDSFSVRAKDSLSYSNIGICKLIILPVNDTPVTINAIDTLQEDELLIKPVKNGLYMLSTDIDKDSLSFNIIKHPMLGQLNLNPDGSFIYKPKENIFGEDSFTFVAKDSQLTSNISTYYIQILPVNDPPLVSKDTMFYQLFPYEKIEFNQTSEIFTLISDVDNTKNELLLIFNEANVKGTFTKEGQTMVYSPPVGYFGIDNISFKVRDSLLTSNQGNIVVRIVPQIKRNNFDEIKLYPNPTSGSFTIDHLTIDKAIIVSIDGRNMQNLNFSESKGKLSFKLDGLNAGQYILYLYYKNKIIAVKKIIFDP